MHIFTAAQVRAADKRAVEEFAIPGQLLMEHAGLHVAKWVWRRLPLPGRARVVVFAGPGNNGGDGFVAARHLHNWGARVRVYAVGRSGRENPVPGDGGAKVSKARNGERNPGGTSDARRARDMAVACGVDVVPWTEAEERRARLNVAAADVVVDALLGTGAVGEPRPDARQAIGLMNEGQRPVISVDMPSGVAADTGGVAGAAVWAHETITFGGLKLGLVLGPGRQHAGRVVVADIGWPPPVLEGARHTWVTAAVVAPRVPARPVDGHKGTFGRVLIVAGQRGMAGAAALTVRGAQRVGAGLVTLAAPQSLNDVYVMAVPEALTMPLAEDEHGAVHEDGATAVAEALRKADVVAVGPGLGTGLGARAVLQAVLDQATVPVVLDADALNVVADAPRVLEGAPRNHPLIVTPHPGEMARLLGVPVAEITARPVEVARDAAARWRAVVVLKGAPTVVAEPEGHVFVNGSGSSALASGGTGDVLTGAIAGLLAQGTPPVDAALVGVFVHGAAGDHVAARWSAPSEGRSGALFPWTAGAVAPGPSLPAPVPGGGRLSRPPTGGVVAMDVADGLPAALAAVAHGRPLAATGHVADGVLRIFE